MDAPLTPPIILTAGHSTKPLDDFVHMLQAHAAKQMIDVRAIPRSRRNPQFNLDTLPKSLAAHEIHYLHMPGLGGRREPRPDSTNGAWRNDSFRGYADYMQTAEFSENLTALIAAACRQRSVIVCAEAVPWRCHRSLIADALLVRQIPVEHILSESSIKPHSLTPFACVDGVQVTYPGL